MLRKPLGLAVIALLVVSCRSRNETPASDTTTGAMDTAMKGMAGMHTDSAGRAMMARMQEHMGMMDTASATAIQSMLPMHRQMLDSMLTSVNDEMRRRNITPSAEWTATTDSLRQDLNRMAGMSASELTTLMRAHRARMTRVMEMHRTMMGRPPTG